MADVRKSIDQLKREHDEDRALYGKPFFHEKSGQEYQLLFCSFDEATNEKQAVYVLCSMPWLKFTRPFDDFKSKFEEGHASDKKEAR